MKAAFYTLGCKVNQNESLALEEIFRSAGFEIVQSAQNADVFVVNSCTVTAQGDAKSRRALGRAKTANPNIITVLTGCSPQAFPQNASTFGADIVTGTSQRGLIIDNINQFIATGKGVVNIAPLAKSQSFEELPSPALQKRTRAFVKIEDGCNRKCAYCIIPTARGPARSRSQTAILEEVLHLASKGYSEVVFTGINLSSYGKDTGTNLGILSQKAAELPGICRVRLSSLEPDLLTDEQIELLAANQGFCRHFHLSLQSGCAKTLRNMRRVYSPMQYAALVEKLRKKMPDASFTTDIIVGFPGETAADFEESLAFVQKMQFLKVHVFPFSARNGTPAASFAGQIAPQEKAARAAEMQKTANIVQGQWLAAQNGSTHQILLESRLPSGHFTGYTKNYIPVLLNAPNARNGNILSARLGIWDGRRCTAELT